MPLMPRAFAFATGRKLADTKRDLEREVAQRKRAETIFRGLLESAPNAMVIVDAKGNIALVNGQTERLFGYQREEVVGKPVSCLCRSAFADAT